MHGPRPKDERRHRSGPQLDWQESWYLDFWNVDASIGGYVSLAIFPNRLGSWLWACLVREGQPLVAVIELDGPLPKSPGLEIRSSGLWVDLIVETPMEHVSVGLEAFGVAMDDPTDAFGKGWGDRTPLGFDLEWETDGRPFRPGIDSRYELPCRVHGEILVGSDVIDFDGCGQRCHEWGPRDWWSHGWSWSGGRLDDGARLHAISIPDLGWGAGSVGGAPVVVNGVAVGADIGSNGLATTARLSIGDVYVAVEPTCWAPVAVPDNEQGRVTHLARSLVRFLAADGRRGAGWLELNQPQA